MRQLDLFGAAHVSRARCRRALERLDLEALREELGKLRGPLGAERDRKRLDVVAARLGRWPPDTSTAVDEIHTAFESALREPGERDFLDARSWGRLYAWIVSRALVELGGAFRGWGAIHFAWSCGDIEGVEREVERAFASERAPQAWLEVARFAWAAHDVGRYERALLIATLNADRDLYPDPPVLAPAGAPELALRMGAPDLPDALLDALAEAEELDLMPPASAWLAPLLAIDGRLSSSALAHPDVIRHTGFGVASEPELEPTPARRFLRLLHSARSAPASDAGDPELERRVGMKALAPPLLQRYLARGERR